MRATTSRLAGPYWVLLVGLGARPAAAPAQSSPTRPVDAWRVEVQARVHDASRAFAPRAGGYAAATDGGLRGRFDADGAHLVVGDDTIGLRAGAIGREGMMEGFDRVVPTPGDCVPDRFLPDGTCVRALAYVSAEATEWWVSRDRAFEQGFSVDAPPAGDGALVIALDVVGATATADGADVLLSGDGGGQLLVSEVSASDADGTPLVARLEAASRGVTVVVDDAGARYPIAIDPTVSTPEWTVDGEPPNNPLGWTVGGAGDVNGDGYDDALVGAYAYSDYTGAVYVYLGSSSGLSDVASATLVGEAASDYFSYSLGSAGDVNGDGYGDVIVGAIGHSSNIGRAYVYLGSPSGLSSTATKLDGESSSYFGMCVRSAGDVNGDGYGDVVVGAPNYGGYTGRAYVYLGSSSGLSTTASTKMTGEATSDTFGQSVAGGDVNGDGYSDIIVGAPRHSGSDYIGRAYVYLGAYDGVSSAADAVFAPASGANDFGVSVATADVDGDGYADVIVGSDYSTPFADVFMGSAGGASTTAAVTLSPSGGTYFGQSVSAAGDVNGDGYADVIVGAYGSSSVAGTAYVYEGSASGLSSASVTTLAGETTYSYFGYSVSGAGDVDGDGYSDVIVGAFGYSPTFVSSTGEAYGRAYLYSGSPSGVSTTASTTITGHKSPHFAFSLAGAGDVNGDGYTDVLVGAYGEATNTGSAYLYLGSASGPGSLASTTLTGAASGDEFGFSLASAGDVDHDGFGDVIIGAPGVASSTGAAYVYRGSSSGLATTPVTLGGEATADAFGTSVSSAGDVDGDGYGDVVVGAPGHSSSAGRAYLYRGASTGLSTSASTTLGGESTGNLFGSAVASAGDVDGDGHGDVVIGAPDYGATANGRAYVYLGSSSGLSTTVKRKWTGEGPDNYFGAAVAGAGDVDGDGYDDVIVGAWGFSEYVGATYVYQEGRTYVYRGSSAGPASSATTTMSGEGSYQYLGGSVAGAGDVDGDGYADVVVGADGYSADVGRSKVYGRAYVYAGTASGTSSTAATKLTGDENGGEFGIAVAGAGDVDGDGYDDVLVGASDEYGGWSGGGGRASLYAGSAPDADGDGVPASVDCDDTDPKVGAPTIRYLDGDGDGYGGPTSASVCPSIAGYVDTSTDCDDGASAVHPAALEVCNGIDDNCDGNIDEGVLLTWYEDADGDGYGATGSTVSACTAPSGYVAIGGDTDDSSSAVHPGATEVCNGVDDDSDGLVDEGVTTTFYADGDGDGYGDPTATTQACAAPKGYVADDTDCDDASAVSHPGAAEICDGLDNNCDGSVDEGVLRTYYRDADGDGFGTETSTTTGCTAPSGYSELSTDCDDTSAGINIDAAEICDGVDDNCDGRIDEGVTTTYYADGDHDGYGDVNNPVELCGPEADYVRDDTDCNDTDATIHPGATEIWYDGIDEACDFGDDNDQDGDGHDAVAMGGDDCDDLNPAVFDTCDHGSDPGTKKGAGGCGCDTGEAPALPYAGLFAGVGVLWLRRRRTLESTIGADPR